MTDDALGMLAPSGVARPSNDPERSPAAGEGGTRPNCVLKLYVASLTPRSVAAIQSVTALCETRLAGHYELEIIDIYEQPCLAKGAQVVAAPTLVKTLPLPLRRLIGDMADPERILTGLGLQPPSGAVPQR